MEETYYLVPLEPKDVYELTEVIPCGRVRCDERSDYVWAKVTPALDAASFGRQGTLTCILLAPRHAGETIDAPTAWPVHVYVCAAKSGVTACAPEVAPDDLDVLNWGLLYDSRADAEAKKL